VTRRLLSRLFDAAKADDFEVCALWISRVHNTVLDAAAGFHLAAQLAEHHRVAAAVAVGMSS